MYRSESKEMVVSGKDKPGETGITPNLSNADLSWDAPDAADVSAERKKSLAGSLRAPSWARRGKKAEARLPRNWKRVTDAEGQVSYLNAVTLQRCLDVPPSLPRGWREAVHAESGRLYYYHKRTQQTSLEWPSETAAAANDDDDDDDDGEAVPPPPEGLLSRALNKISRSRKASVSSDGSDLKSADPQSRKPSTSGEAAELGGAEPARARRGNSFGRAFSFGKRPKSAKEAKEEGGKLAKEEGSKGTAAGSDGITEASMSSQTVFISCSALLREVKLCVPAVYHLELEEMLRQLASKEVAANTVVARLMERVGSTVVQQAGLSVMNFQKGLLPHGWLEYLDDNTGRPYYYNVHTKVTTWDAPSMEGATSPQMASPEMQMATPEGAPGEDDADGINITCTPETHFVAMTGFI